MIKAQSQLDPNDGITQLSSVSSNPLPLPASGGKAPIHKVLNLPEEICMCSERFARLADQPEWPGQYALKLQYVLHDNRYSLLDSV